ncbi:MAG: hypothetical protein DRN96_02830 [Thermoproteota archaeon]|nr:MAG: hypothetical protein DRN96_02830 [Candidatus Korarchaeota archaeon]RLG55941.1 MAG: hypothetical protein DRN99_01240 [Candidatus Korarchaeota archaeon]
MVAGVLMNVILLLKVKAGREEVLSEIRRLPGVVECNMVFGIYDAVVVLEGEERKVREAIDSIRELPGVRIREELRERPL